MVRSAVRVVVRTRPTEHGSESVKVAKDGNSIMVHVPRNKDSGFVNNAQEDFSYPFTHILDNSPQEMVYAVAAHDVVESALEGYNGTVMTYGQTGAGKTYTMSGGDDFKTRGIIPRAVADLFGSVQQLPDKLFEITISYLEIYNERVFDLLEPSSNPEDFQILEDTMGQITVKGIAQKAAKSESEALALLFEGNTNRAVAQHQLNQRSSRSHCVFTIHIRSRSLMESEGHTLQSKLHLIDLAGSERVSKTHPDGQMLKEVQYINKSLSFLEQVVLALSSQNRQHVPFRQSKLTNMLKGSLGGNCKTTLIANVWCENTNLEETVSTLKFAQRMMRIQNDASVNIVIDPSAQIKLLERQITELKNELQMQNQLYGKTNVTYDEFSEEERYEVQQKVDKYLEGPPLIQGELPEFIEIRNLREVKEYFRIFHNCVKRAEADAEAHPKDKGEQEDKGGPGQSAGDVGAEDTGVGEVDGGAGFGVGSGVAADGLRQAVASSNRYAAQSKRPATGADAGAGGGGDEEAVVARVTQPDKGQSYEDFKSNEGAQLAELLRKSLADLKEKKKKVAESAKLVNDEKTNIDRLRTFVEAKRKGREDEEDGEALDHEELDALKGLKAAKLRYKQLFEEAAQHRTQREYAQRMVDQAREKLITDFEQWFEATYPADAVAQDVGSFDDERQRTDDKVGAEEDPAAAEFYKAQRMLKQGPRPPGGRNRGRGAGAGAFAARAARQR
eukprot:Hpha_TRINITY_DN16150_c1_g6::TRINITY_DN16150_c1_g6_i2::g.3605::m.3605/K10397/KIF6_9; kinesin family member 6/9